MTTIEALNAHLTYILDEIRDYMYPPIESFPTAKDDVIEPIMELLDPLDVYTVQSDNTVYGHILLISFGGPNIYVNTFTNRIEGYWGTSYSSYPFDSRVSSLIEQYYSN